MNSARDGPFRFFAKIIMFIFDHLSKYTPIEIGVFFKIENPSKLRFGRWELNPIFQKGWVKETYTLED